MATPASSWTGLGLSVGVLGVAAMICRGIGPDEPQRTAAIAFAAAVCLAGTVGAWLAASRPTDTAIARTVVPLSAMAMRLVPALAALAWLQTAGAAMRAAGAGRLLVIFYLATLAVDVIRTIIGRGNPDRRPRGDGGV